MKQILQNLGNGETILAEVPCPLGGRSKVLVETTRTLVSLGTEKMLIDFGKGGLLAKARSQPDKVKQVLQKIKTDGLWTTIDAVKAKLDTPIPLGYCNVGRVLDTSSNGGFVVGDRIASNGPHAEVVSVPTNLCAKIPDNVSDETAVFTVVGAIGLQGIRLLQPTLCEKIVVSGLGLIGLLSVQILKANGCEVLGIDFDAKKLELARQFGAETVDLSAGQDPVAFAENWTRGNGVDGVLITASAKTDELIHQAATMCRKRGRIVLVGVIGLNLQRADFYEKELSFQVSCSYGPGRYDSNYEKKGLDYPIGFVRWTEQRNFEAVLALMAAGKIDVTPLISHRFSFENALDGYGAINESGALGIILEYDTLEPKNRDTIIKLGSANPKPIENSIGVAFIGAGGFTTRMLLPSFPKPGVHLHSVVSSTGVSAAYAAKKFGFTHAASDSSAVIGNPDIDVVFITTPHNSHARLVCESLAAGKHVFVEKPLAMNEVELGEVEEAIRENREQRLMVGFNRRFSPHTMHLKKMLNASPGPKAIMITVNAGAIPSDHWTQDAESGGGRIIGEACHFIDLARFIANSKIVGVNAVPIATGEGRLGDCVSIQLTFADGSIATVHYLANGSKNFPKERVEVFAGGDVLTIDNFRKTWSANKNSKIVTRKQDKGHAEELRLFIDSLTSTNESPIPVEELIEVSTATIDAAKQVRDRIAKFE